MESIIYIAVAIALVIVIIKSAWKLVKFLCLVGVIAMLLLLLSNLGVFSGLL